MHWLDRSKAQRPSCLDDYNWRARDHHWDSKDPEFRAKFRPCKKAMRVSLDLMQGGLCAYCEGEIYSHYRPKDGEPVFEEVHIEHFRRKDASHFPELMFEWTNLFLSCQSDEHCGHYKDKPSTPDYEPDLLLKPDEDNPDDYLYFHQNGEVRVRGKITPAQISRAKETIRTFHLDHPGLAGEREQAVKRFKRIVGFDKLVDGLSDEELPEMLELLRQESPWIAQEPYCTTIRHFLERPA